MKLTHDPIRLHISQKILAAVQKAYPQAEVKVADLYQALVEPPNTELGDLAFGCFILSKLLKTGPPVVAKLLQENLHADDVIAQATAAGPYLNLKIQVEALGKNVLEPILNSKYFTRKLSEKNPRTMIEYSQPNTHKELHVGHMRNLCLGDGLVRMLKYSGHEILTSTFPGDMGTHVAKCLWYLKLHNDEPVPKTNRGEWLGRMYSKAHIKLEDEEAGAEGPKNKADLTLIIKDLEEGHGEYYKLWKETREWSIDLMKQVYAWADVEFDYWYWESDVDAASVKFAKKCFAEGKLVESQGAIGMNLENENLGFCLLLKTDGTGLYATKDLELARRKFEDVHIEKSIYVVDTRQSHHFKQVFRVLEILGFEQAKLCLHLQYNFVELPDGAMSSRKGNIVPLLNLIHQMEQMVKERYLSRYANEWTQSEIDQTASIIAKGAIRYGMLRIDTNKAIVFDMDEWLKIDGESGPFIQYSYARIASLGRKLGFEANRDVKFGLLTHQAEKNLSSQLMNFNSVVSSASESFKPNSLCNYLYDLAKKFNVFYHECPIANSGSDELTNARLALAMATGIVIKQGLGLLGVPVPERM